MVSKCVLTAASALPQAARDWQNRIECFKKSEKVEYNALGTSVHQNKKRGGKKEKKIAYNLSEGGVQALAR